MPWSKADNGFPIRLPRPRTAINSEGIKRDVVVIGASAGGVMALRELFAAFPAGMPAAVGVVLHRSAAPGELAQVLGRRSALPVIEPAGRTAMKQGHIYLAPPDHHLLFETGRRLAIRRGPREHSTRPAVDPLFRSAAETYGRRVVGILLTGCGEDGVSGLIAIAKASGLTLAQDPEEAYMPSMPLNALRYDDVNGVFRIDELGPVVAALAAGREIPARRATRR
ncbi:chemotaxis protein CheB [Nitrospira moscoviensis]|uniref:chemotaxis protein CheB n=1 Tax=Nitrospira moscoviensis TaxID=42253 RepID=UPI0006A75C30|nr:chemotaxis protein CheB [Nitrospira moscoviensis]